MSVMEVKVIIEISSYLTMVRKWLQQEVHMINLKLDCGN
jgi:hypothetical protein